MHNMTIRSVQLLLGTFALAFSMGVQADTTYSAVGAGWYSNAGEHVEFNDNYSVGGAQSGYTLNNYFLFDLSGVSGPITAAILRVYNPDTPVSPGFPFGYTSSDPTENYALFDVSTATADLVSGYGVGSLVGQAIFSDLGSGQIFGLFCACLAVFGLLVVLCVFGWGVGVVFGGLG